MAWIPMGVVTTACKRPFPGFTSAFDEVMAFCKDKGLLFPCKQDCVFYGPNSYAVSHA